MADPRPYQESAGLLPAQSATCSAPGWRSTRFGVLPSEGSYFQCVDISKLAVPERTLGEAEFCQWLTHEIGVAAIPLSAFYGDGFDQGVVRFCFAKKDETLNLALERLARL
jgi:methionine aminotransferase